MTRKTKAEMAQEIQELRQQLEHQQQQEAHRRVPLSTRIPAHLDQQLRQHCARTGARVQETVTEAIQRFLSEQ